MKLFENFRDALKIAKKIREVKKYLNETHLTKDVKDDITIMKEAGKRLAAKIPAFEYIFSILF